MQKGKQKIKKRKTSNEEKTCNPTTKQEISRSGDHNSDNNNRRINKASIL